MLKVNEKNCRIRIRIHYSEAWIRNTAQYVPLQICFYINKSEDFRLCCVIKKEEEKNSGFIAATLYMVNDRFDNVCNMTLKKMQQKYLNKSAKT